MHSLMNESAVNSTAVDKNESYFSSRLLTPFVAFFKNEDFHAILGGVVGFWGGVFGLGVIFLLLVAFRRHRKRLEEEAKNPSCGEGDEDAGDMFFEEQPGDNVPPQRPQLQQQHSKPETSKTVNQQNDRKTAEKRPNNKKTSSTTEMVNLKAAEEGKHCADKNKP